MFVFYEHMDLLTCLKCYVNLRNCCVVSYCYTVTIIVLFVSEAMLLVP